MAPRAFADPPPPPTAAPQPPPKLVASDREDRAKAALALHDEAWALYEQGQYRAAIDRLEAAVRVDPAGSELVYNLGLLHEKLADLKTAASYYRRYVEMETDPKAKARAAATLRRVEGAERAERERIPVAAIAMVPPPSPPEPPPPPSHRTAVIVATGVAIGAFATGLGCGVSALVKNPGEAAHTGGSVTIATLQDEAHDAHNAAIAADVALIVAAAAAATAMVLHFTSGPARPSSGARGAPARGVQISASLVPRRMGAATAVGVTF